MEATGSIVAKVSPERAFEFVLDTESYLRVDTRITAMNILWREEGLIVLSVRSYIRYPLLETHFILRVHLSPYQRIVMETEPGSMSFPGSLFLEQLRAEFLFEQTYGGVKIVHKEHYVTKDTLLGRLMERRGQDWLRQHMEDVKMPRLKERLERHGHQET